MISQSKTANFYFDLGPRRQIKLAIACENSLDNLFKTICQDSRHRFGLRRQFYLASHDFKLQ